MNEKEELANRIKKLREKIGEVYPIIVDKEGKIIDGWHRLEASPDWTKKVVDPKNRYEEALIWFAAHERRQTEKKEIQVKFITMAEELIKQGVDKGQIAAKIAEDTGYTLQYVLTHLPSKYKLEEKRAAGKKGAAVRSVYAEEIRKEIEQKQAKPPTKYLCPLCGGALAFVGDLLVPYHEALKRR
jgi:hypothetical protein